MTSKNYWLVTLETHQAGNPTNIGFYFLSLYLWCFVLRKKINAVIAVCRIINKQANGIWESGSGEQRSEEDRIIQMLPSGQFWLHNPCCHGDTGDKQQYENAK